MSTNGTTPVPEFGGYTSPNYTQVPDELFDRQLPDLTGAELKVLLYVMRRTFGFKKDADNISLNQISRGITTHDGRVLDRGTGLSQSTVQVALKGLIAKQIVLATKRVSKEKGNEATTYRLNLGTPFTENRWRGAPEIGEGLHRKSVTQETVKQETVINSKFRKARPEKSKTDGETEPTEQGRQSVSHQAQPYPSGSAGSGETTTPEKRAVAPQDAPNDPKHIPQEPARTRPLSDPTAKFGPSQEPINDPPAGEGFERLRATMEQIRQKAAEEREAREHKTGRRQSEPAAPIPAAAPVPPQPPVASDSGATPIAAILPTNRGRPPGSRDERDHIAAYLGDWLAQFNDQAPQSASITRAYNALTRANVPPERWGDYLHEAKSILREHQAQVTTKADKQTNAYQPKNLTPYYFAVLEDLLGMRPAHAAPRPAQPARPGKPTGEDRTQIGFGDKTDPAGRPTPMLRSMP